MIIIVLNKLSFRNYRNSMNCKIKAFVLLAMSIVYTPSELIRIMTKNGLKPILFTPSAGDFSNKFKLIELVIRH